MERARGRLKPARAAVGAELEGGHDFLAGVGREAGAAITPAEAADAAQQRGAGAPEAAEGELAPGGGRVAGGKARGEAAPVFQDGRAEPAGRPVEGRQLDRAAHDAGVGNGRPGGEERGQRRRRERHVVIEEQDDCAARLGEAGIARDRQARDGIGQAADVRELGQARQTGRQFARVASARVIDEQQFPDGLGGGLVGERIDQRAEAERRPVGADDDREAMARRGFIEGAGLGGDGLTLPGGHAQRVPERFLVAIAQDRGAGRRIVARFRLGQDHVPIREVAAGGPAADEDARPAGGDIAAGLGFGVVDADPDGGQPGGGLALGGHVIADVKGAQAQARAEVRGIVDRLDVPQDGPERHVAAEVVEAQEFFAQLADAPLARGGGQRVGMEAVLVKALFQAGMFEAEPRVEPQEEVVILAEEAVGAVGAVPFAAPEQARRVGAVEEGAAEVVAVDEIEIEGLARQAEAGGAGGRLQGAADRGVEQGPSRLVDQVVVGVDGIGGGALAEHGDKGGKEAGAEPVVVAGPGVELAAGGAKAGVERAGQALVGLMDDADAGVSARPLVGQVAGAVGRAVVDEDQFPVRPVLRADGLNGFVEMPAAVERGQDDRNPIGDGPGAQGGEAGGAAVIAPAQVTPPVGLQSGQQMPARHGFAPRRRCEPEPGPVAGKGSVTPVGTAVP
ncbi:MAG: hypothetical protein BWZ08_02117 [candidate division BRC1 bacterium ADurb.BinA292]|nr:MAG: hypothetical protein BWZ08_02117 [candidate division BRC1 bacterium ADurb.BinA292]